VSTIDNSKTETVLFAGTIIDVLEFQNVKTKYAVRNQLRIIWVLGNSDSGGYFLDGQGIPFRVFRQVNATMNPRSRLHKIVRRVLGTAPPIPFDTEDLIGRSNILSIAKEFSNGKFYANVKAILPLQRGDVGPAIPQDFVRAKDRPKNTFSESEEILAKKSPVVALPQPPITPRLLTIREAAVYLSCSFWAVRELIWSRQLPKIKIGRRFCIAREDLDAWIDRQRAKSD
jgi:excisionase family DNA binding protein